MEFLLFLVIGFAVLMFIATISSANTLTDKTREIEKRAADSFSGFVSSKTFIKLIGPSQKPEGILLDNNSKQIIFVKDGMMWPHKFDSLIECETIIDGKTKTKTSRASQFGGAAVGGLLLGPVGALAGALSAKKEHIKEVKNVSLKILVDDLNNPIHTINFGLATTEANHWADTLGVIITHCEREAARFS